MDPTLRIVLAVTGASGSVHARHLLRLLAAAERVAEVHVVASSAGVRVAREELDATASSAAQPKGCVRLEALPNLSLNHGSMASTTRGSQGVVAWWSR